ncbi:CLUMA_CG003482, isoform A [Clunio marinus]|uniref:CLUMA_CG003482, isoform A n=1 Tax=Clunio marinus TaxID=568069 RepID=A0A1J1HP39_9DIPT|nr:CLUMA_CG003482, isoform A [Clunio marinus]
MHKSDDVFNDTSRHLIRRKSSVKNNKKESKDLLVNCDNKTSHCNRYVAKALISGQNRSKLSIDDESSHPINGASTNNKSERKRNINMVNDGDKKSESGLMLDEKDARDNMKRMKVDVIVDDRDENKRKMYQIYQPWVIHTYGDLSKSKTITSKKQSRIVSALKGLETNRPDSSKFRFWVKSKGFMMQLPVEFQHVKQNQIGDDGCLLFIPSKTDINNISYKRVAVVEYFFNIIYKVHCSVGEGEGRHVGQKRTYRKITECYAFLPREAVTKFLTHCNECRKSMKSMSVQEISEVDQHQRNEKNLSDDVPKNPASFSDENYPKNMKNYLSLLHLLYEKSSAASLLNRIQEQSCEKTFEPFKENIDGNQIGNNGNSNQQQQVHRKNININIKNESELDNSISDVGRAVGGERSLGNIVINSLDVSINVAGKANYCSSYGNNINNVRISCSTTPPLHHSKYVPLPLSSPDTQQLVTSSSSEPNEEENNFDRNRLVNSSSSSPSSRTSMKNNSTTHDALTRAVYNKRVKMVPDNISFDYHQINDSDDVDENTTSNNTTCKNNFSKYPNGERNVDEDYHIDASNCNKQNHSTSDIKPITSTYLLMTRSMGLADEDALNLVS